MARAIKTILQGELRKKESKIYRLQREMDRVEEEISELRTELEKASDPNSPDFDS